MAEQKPGLFKRLFGGPETPAPTPAPSNKTERGQ